MDDGWEPDWAVPASEVLAEVLEERGMTQRELSRQTGLNAARVSRLVNNQTVFRATDAVALERVLGISARLWLNLDTTYRLHLARRTS